MLIDPVLLDVSRALRRHPRKSAHCIVATQIWVRARVLDPAPRATSSCIDDRKSTSRVELLPEVVYHQTAGIPRWLRVCLCADPQAMQ